MTTRKSETRDGRKRRSVLPYDVRTITESKQLRVYGIGTGTSSKSYRVSTTVQYLGAVGAQTQNGHKHTSDF
jgi:hypothetical protein